jgi:hypothetical protein
MGCEVVECSHTCVTMPTSVPTWHSYGTLELIWVVVKMVLPIPVTSVMA